MGMVISGGKDDGSPSRLGPLMSHQTIIRYHDYFQYKLNAALNATLLIFNIIKVS